MYFYDLPYVFVGKFEWHQTHPYVGQNKPYQTHPFVGLSGSTQAHPWRRDNTNTNQTRFNQTNTKATKTYLIYLILGVAILEVKSTKPCAPLLMGDSTTQDQPNK